MMYISQLKIQNIGRLKKVVIDLQNDTTLFVGSNNSGKTTAMNAISLFLIHDKKFSIYDFSICNHKIINELFDKDEPPTTEQLNNIFPTFDLWFDVKEEDIHYVGNLIPTLDWQGGALGVRLRYEINDIGKLFMDYKDAKNRIKNKDNLYPMNIMDYLSKNLSNYFNINYYLLNPDEKNLFQQQNTLGEALESNPLDDILCIDVINAQREMIDELSNNDRSEKKKLIKLISEYYKRHLDVDIGVISEEDIKTLEDLNNASVEYTKKVSQNFKPALDELKEIGYPPFGMPKIEINPKLNVADSLNHSNALQYNVGECCLPENYNGLGYQNLIYIVFKLISFRDKWIKYHKMQEFSDQKCCPIHLVLIEEPEAHLHPQAQQVFIKKAYEILQGREEIKNAKLTTQLIVSTHSPHIIHELEFENLRYFKKGSEIDDLSTDIINLSTIFSEQYETKQFTRRYIKLTHCDLFFADAAILIEGDAERILMPSFISKFNFLNSAYITVLTIGGNYAFKLYPLMEKLAIPTLIITDIDVVECENDKTKLKQKTCNPTLKNILSKESIDELMSLTLSDKTKVDPFPLGVVYQYHEGERTFEDALKADNSEFKNSTKDKVDLILHMLSTKDPKDIEIPYYIKDGLEWLDGILQHKLNIGENI